MGTELSKSVSNFFGKREYRIIVIGLDFSGKTSILNKLNPENTIRPIGYSLETFIYKQLSFTVWDLCGHEKLRFLWKYYFQNTDGIVFVVDSNDKERMDEAVEEFNKIIIEEELKDAALLVMANKQDMPDALSPNDILKKFEFANLKGRKCRVQGTSAKTGEGIEEGLTWLNEVLN